MRTTLNIDDEIYSIVKQLAFENNGSVEATISRIIKKNFKRQLEKDTAKKGFPALPVFENTDCAELITTEKIN